MLVTPKQNMTGIMSSESTFHSTSTFCKWEEPFLQLTKEATTIHIKENIINERIQDIPEGNILIYCIELRQETLLKMCF